MNENTRIKTLAAATARTWDAFVIVVGMLKGGTGKTTSAWFIALYYAVVLNLPTLLLDADATSQSAYDWFKVAQAGRGLRNPGQPGGRAVPVRRHRRVHP
ncbi:hypothetical protein ACLB9X_02395 [Streptomyces sp. 5K101]|uniref:hypothetical protein n=1 Tax=Streptomyces sp. 5K101 TaxID=3390037 RepID=UPI003975242F